ncbi:MAG: cytosol nonspecific dipeptidase, partial [Chitinophagales bacterium]
MSNNTLENLQPFHLWNHFSQLNAVPRASKKEAQVIQFMKDFGQKLGLETIEDETGNVLIKKPATVGRESKATVILQGHLDMVHQKNADT